MSRLWREHVVFTACLAALVAFPLLSPPQAFAGHDAGESCYNCHTLDQGEGDANSSYINKLSRTFPRIKDYDGLPPDQTPANLGCTYCHNDNSNATAMKSAITHFQGYTSFHPVGLNYSTGLESTNEYLSTLGTVTVNELDCVDCHDLVNWADGQDDETTVPEEDLDNNPATSLGGPNGKYPEHGRPIDRTNNPFMLRNVTVADEYDALCRYCHDSTGDKTLLNGKVIPKLLSHADNAAGRPLLENDSTALKTADLDGNGVADVAGLATTAQCTVCHDTHYSQNRRLFNDGHEQHKTGTGMVADADVMSSTCTAVCHYAGDRYGNYTQHGHGLAQSTYKYANGVPSASGTNFTMGFGCTACHLGLDPAQRLHADKNPTGSNQEKYVKRFNLSGAMQAGDTGSAMGNPLVGICLACHQSYEEHQTVSQGGIGCQDCHDEHAEGSGSASNVMMIPEKAKKKGYYIDLAPAANFYSKPGTESITYDTPKWNTASSPYVANLTTTLDFFRQADAAGVCDSAECHGAKYTPLSTWINNGATTHSQGQQLPGTDCNSCHAHNGDQLGGWRALSSCEDCHALAGRTHLGTTKSAATHNAHLGSEFVTNCADCHPHNGQGAGTGVHGVGGVVNFGGPRMTTAFNYSDTFNTEANCNLPANGCHDNAGGAGRWNATTLTACADCHSGSKLLGTAAGVFPPTSNEHTLHLANNAYVTGDPASSNNYDCDVCHGTGADDGGHTGHVNSSMTIATSGTFVKINIFNSVAKTCTNDCHLADVAGKSWAGASALVCTDCHSGTQFIGGDRTGTGGANYLPQSGLHDGVPTVSGRTHDDSFLYNNELSTAVCDTCHTTVPTNPGTAHQDGTWDASIGADDVVLPEVHFNSSVGFTDSATPTCAPSFTGCHTDQGVGGNTWGRKWIEGADQTTGAECAGCHGGSPTDAAPTVWTAWATPAGTLARPAMAGATPSGGPAAATQPHLYDWDGVNGERVQGTHANCKNCHGMNSPTDAETAYNLTTFWGAGGGNHGNGSIDMNGPSALSNQLNNAVPFGAQFNGADDATLETSDWSCTNACHQGVDNVNKNLGNSGWPVKYGDYGGGDCNGCHGYPPLTAADFAAKGANYPDALLDTAYGGYADGGAGHNIPEHLATTVVATQGWTPCLPCHDSTSHMTTSTVTRNNITLVQDDVDFPAAYDAKSGAGNYVPGAGPNVAYCTNVSCHGGQNTPVWSGGTLDVNTCSLCHIAEAAANQAAATQWNSGWSGGHARAGSVSLENHTATDASLGDLADSDACTDCHGLPAQHFAGMDTTATDPLVDADFVSTWDGTGGNISVTGCTVICHSDTNTVPNPDVPRWAHKWSSTITTVTANGSLTGPECANCHGTQADGWVAGISHRTDAGPYNLHGTTLTYPARGCNECHAIGDISAVYDFTPKWAGGGATSHHGDDTIQLNSNGSSVQRLTGVDAGETGCSVCHSASDGFAPGSHGYPTVTRWAFATLANGQYSGCTGCHGTSGAAGGNFWPDAAGSNVGTYPDRDGRHGDHILKIVARLNDNDSWTDGLASTNHTLPPALTLSKLNQQQVCDFCHYDALGFPAPNHYPVGYDANLTARASADPAEVATIKRIWPPYANDAGTAFTFTQADNSYDGSGNLVAPTLSGRGCNAVDCHNQQNTPAGFEWYGATASSCVMCHVNVTLAGDLSHNAHLTTTTRVAGQAGLMVCANCHDAATSWVGNTPPAGANHINGAFAVAGNVTFTYSGYSYPTTNGTCGIFLCHNNGQNAANYNGGAASYTWGTAIGTVNTCNECHRDTAAPLNTGGHQRHIQTTTRANGGLMTCDSCHAAATAATHGNGTINFVAPATGYNGDVIVVGHVNDTGTCGINTCHNNGKYGNPDQASYPWGTPYGAGDSCVECHGDTAALMTTEAHAAHLNASAGYGINVGCANCHGASAQTQAAHANGTVTLAGFTYAGGDVIVNGGTTFGTCGVNACHNDGAGLTGQQSNPLWNAAPLGCVNCHQDTTGMASNAHNEHTQYTNMLCTDCHTGATLGTHVNGSTNLNGATVTYSKSASFPNDNTAAGNCTTSACHNRTLASVGWDQAALTCTSCHGNGSAQGLSGSHDPHLVFGKLCTDCHAAAPDTTHISTRPANLTNSANAAAGEAGVVHTGVTWTSPNCLYSGANGVLGCHATGNAGWGVPTSADACIECHTNTTTSQVNPVSGVHGATRIANNAHDSSWRVTDASAEGSATCETCHTAAPSSGHQNATLQGAPTVVFAANVNFTDATATCAPGGALSTCHDDGGAWSRQWSASAGLNTGAECANCHGGVGAGYTGTAWVGGISSSHSDPQITPNHDVCYYCHLYKNGDVTYYNIASATQHRDGNIEIGAQNDSGTDTHIGFRDNGATVGCVNCHSATDGVGNTLHEFTDVTTTTRWGTRDLLITGPVFDCNSCHALPASRATHGDTNESSALHDLHTNSSLGLVCADCHANPGGAGHNNASTVQLDGSKITTESYLQGSFDGNCANTCHTPASSTWVLPNTLACVDCHAATRIGGALLGAHAGHGITVGATGANCVNCHNAGAYTKTLGVNGGTPLHGNNATNFSGVSYTGARNVLTGTCTTSACHNRGAEPSTQWDSAALACNDCHGDIAAGLGGAHAAHFAAAYIADCSECHTTPPADDTGHIGAGDLVNKANALPAEADVLAAARGAIVRATPQTCNTSECHNPSPGAAYVSAAWTATNGGCLMCHGDSTPATYPASADHPDHLNGSATFGRAIACVDCHNALPVDPAHMDNVRQVQVRSTVGVFGALIPAPTAAGACATNECHSSGDLGAPLANTYQWGNATPIANCLECHQNGAAMISNAHNEHTQYTNMACTDCHAAASATSHMNRSTDLGATVTYSKSASFANDATAVGTCTTSACHNRTLASVGWDQAALTCNSCHGNGAGQSLSGSHDPHLVFGKLCTDCHAAAPDTTHISTRPANLTSSANAAAGEAGVVHTGVTWTSPNCLYAGPNGVLGCHATGNAGWGVPTSADACIECHTDNTTAQVNPNTGLHGVTPSVSGRIHDETITGGCEACHTTAPSSTHQNGVLVSTDANLTGTAITTWDDALKTCITNATCHTTQSAGWAHKWNYPATTGTGASNACAGCHGDWDNGWNAGVTHRTTAGTRATHGDQGTSYDCYECHVLESAAYAFTFGTNDWRLTGGTSQHGDATIQVNANTNGVPAALYLQGTFNGVTGTNNRCSGCHTSDDISHQMPDTAWPISTALTTANALTAECNTCHGDNIGSVTPNLGYIYPDGNGPDPDDSAGAHQAHVDAIAAGAGIPAIGGATCDRCHSGNLHATGTVELGFRNVSGGADADGAWAGTPGVSITCTLIDCHGSQSPTQNWYGDLVPPVFSNTALTVTDTITGGDLQVSWFSATDADTPPVSYDLYRLNNNTTGNACTDGARILVASNLGALSYLDTGLSDGTPYRYCVQAKDSVTPTANTANSLSNHNTPSPAPTSQQTDYYLTKNVGTLLWTGNSTNAYGCGSGTIPTIAQVTSTTFPPNARYGLATTQTCVTSSAQNYFRTSVTSIAGYYKNLAAFYKLSAETVTRTATLEATGSTIGLRGSSGAANSEDVQIYLAAVGTTGTHTASAGYGQILNITSTAMANYSNPTLTGVPSISVPANSRLAVLVRWADTSATTSGNDQMAADNYTTTIQPRVRITETIPADTLAPAFPGNNSLITAVDAGTGGAANLSWVAATDTYPSNPVRYTVYRLSSGAQPTAVTLFQAGNIAQNNITALSTTVTGLVNGTNYYWFGVRATDAANNVETANTTITTPGVTPTAPPAGLVCGDCHAIPPATGAHADHADADTDYTDCEACHGTVAGGYTTTPSGTHNNGSASFVAAITYSNGGTPANKSDDTCFTTNCHNQAARGVGSATWTTGGANCNACHYDSAGTNGLSADHAPHLAAAATCSSCHTVPASLAVHALDATGAANDGASLTDRAAALQDEGTVTAVALGPSGTDPDAGNPTCNNMACHDPSVTGGTYAATWITEASTCILCHGDNTPGATRMASNTHTGHLTTTTQAQGGAIVCVNCHGALPVADAHRNGTVALTGAASTYTGDVVLADGDAGDAGTCAVNACHNNGVDSATGTPDTSPYTWNTPVGGVNTCTECHGNTSGSLASNAHNEHIVYAGFLCTDCHAGSATATGHISGTVNLDAAKVTYAGGDLDLVTPNTYGTCTTDSCHNRPIAGSNLSELWSAANLLCDDCHYKNLAGNPTGAANAAHFDPLSATHNAHFNAGKLCANCHGADPGAGDTVHITSKTSLVDGATATQDEANVTRALITWTDGGPGVTDGNTCADFGGGLALGCHANGSADWDVAIAANGCTACHTDTSTATVNPTSGLHAVTPTVSGNAHNGSWDADGGDGSAAADCVTCHTTAPSTSHANGTLDGAPAIAFGASVFYTAGTTPTCGPNGGAYTTCHGPDTGNGDAGSWKRRWDASAANSDGTECANCHGRPTANWDVPGDWTWNEADATTTDHTDPYAGNTGNKMDQHSACRYCHGWGAAAGYTTAWGGGAPGHGDGSITMNGPEPSTGAQYADNAGGCLAGCHTAPSVNFTLNTDSGWNVNYGDYGAGNCEGCHNFDGPGPNVMGDGQSASGVGVVWETVPVELGGPKPYDNGTWGYNVNGHGANGGAPNTPRASASSPYLFGNAACTDCHTLGSTHLNSNLESVEAEQNAAIPNPAHLNGAYISGSSSPEYSVQLTFDNQCSLQCHSAVIRHRHSKDAIPAAGVVRFSDKGSTLNGQAVVGIPIDMHLSSNAPDATANPPANYDYAVCISCHNPHGTTVVEPEKATNRMIRFEFQVTDTLCRKCH